MKTSSANGSHTQSATTAFDIETDSFTSTVVVVRVRGDIDLLTTPELTATLAQMDRFSEVLLDLSAVTFLSSAGIDAILAAHAEIENMRVFAPTNPVRRVLDLFAPELAE